MNRYDRNIYYSFETGKTPTSMKVLNNSLYIVSNDTVYRYDSDPNTYTESSLLSSTRRIGESCTEDAQCEHTICSSSNVCELYSTQYSPFNNLHNYLNSPVYLNSFVCVSSIKFISALSSKAILFFSTTNREPDNLIEVSKSISFLFKPISV